jgi:hypothetical protein
LQTKEAGVLLARVPRDQLADAAVYEYWDGDAWSRDPAAAAPLWPVPSPANDVERLGRFDGGIQISWSAGPSQYLAISNDGHAAIGARVADRLEGPWSERARWLDCAAFAAPAVPVCYSPLVQPQFEGTGTLFVTLTRLSAYEAVSFELSLGAPIHEWRGAGGRIRYAATAPGTGWEDLGVAFHASLAPVDGMVPVYEWWRGDERRYAIGAPPDYERGSVAFYVMPGPAAPGSAVALSAIYEWWDEERQLLSPLDGGLERYGYARGSVAFYAAHDPAATGGQP